MKTPDEWSKEIIIYLHTHPITTVEAARLQIVDIVSWVQKDALSQAGLDAGGFMQRKA